VNPEPLLALLRRLWAHLPAKRRVQLVAVFASMLASGFAEIVSLAAARGLTELAQLLLPATCSSTIRSPVDVE
jgi:hypothetical protein